MVFLKSALMCIKKVKLDNHECLPILLLLNIMLAYLMLFAALSNAACLYNASFFLAIDFCKCFSLSSFVLSLLLCLGLLTHSLFIPSMIFHYAQRF